MLPLLYFFKSMTLGPCGKQDLVVSRALCWPLGSLASTPLLWSGASWDSLPSLDFTITHLHVHPSGQGLLSILISLVAGSQPASRSNDGMCSLGHFLKNQGPRVHF